MCRLIIIAVDLIALLCCASGFAWSQHPPPLRVAKKVFHVDVGGGGGLFLLFLFYVSGEWSKAPLLVPRFLVLLAILLFVAFYFRT